MLYAAMASLQLLLWVSCCADQLPGERWCDMAVDELGCGTAIIAPIAVAWDVLN